MRIIDLDNLLIPRAQNYAAHVFRCYHMLSSMEFNMNIFMILSTLGVPKPGSDFYLVEVMF